jgi:hypothetical protein
MTTVYNSHVNPNAQLDPYYKIENMPKPVHIVVCVLWQQLIIKRRSDINAKSYAALALKQWDEIRSQCADLRMDDVTAAGHIIIRLGIERCRKAQEWAAQQLFGPKAQCYTAFKAECQRQAEQRRQAQQNATAQTEYFQTVDSGTSNAWRTR